MENGNHNHAISLFELFDKHSSDRSARLTDKKSTLVSLIYYYNTKGLRMRSSKKEIPIGYCAESPREVLRNTFANYYVTRYNGYELLNCSGIQSTSVMLGLGISPAETPNIYGIKYDGNIKQLLQLEKLSRVKRNNRISNNDIKNIISRLRETDNDYSSLRYSQMTRDKQEIANIIEELL